MSMRKTNLTIDQRVTMVRFERQLKTLLQDTNKPNVPAITLRYTVQSPEGHAHRVQRTWPEQTSSIV